MTVLFAVLAYVAALAFLLALVGANRRAARRLGSHTVVPGAAEVLPDESPALASKVAPLRPKRLARAEEARDAVGS